MVERDGLLGFDQSIYSPSYPIIFKNILSNILIINEYSSIGSENGQFEVVWHQNCPSWTNLFLLLLKLLISFEEYINSISSNNFSINFLNEFLFNSFKLIKFLFPIRPCILLCSIFNSFNLFFKQLKSSDWIFSYFSGEIIYFKSSLLSVNELISDSNTTANFKPLNSK